MHKMSRYDQARFGAVLETIRALDDASLKLIHKVYAEDFRLGFEVTRTHAQVLALVHTRTCLPHKHTHACRSADKSAHSCMRAHAKVANDTAELATWDPKRFQFFGSLPRWDAAMALVE